MAITCSVLRYLATCLALTSISGLYVSAQTVVGVVVPFDCKDYATGYGRQSNPYVPNDIKLVNVNITSTVRSEVQAQCEAACNAANSPTQPWGCTGYQFRVTPSVNCSLITTPIGLWYVYQAVDTFNTWSTCMARLPAESPPPVPPPPSPPPDPTPPPVPPPPSPSPPSPAPPSPPPPSPPGSPAVSPPPPPSPTPPSPPPPSPDTAGSGRFGCTAKASVRMKPRALAKALRTTLPEAAPEQLLAACGALCGSGCSGYSVMVDRKCYTFTGKVKLAAKPKRTVISTCVRA